MKRNVSRTIAVMVLAVGVCAGAFSISADEVVPEKLIDCDSDTYIEMDPDANNAEETTAPEMLPEESTDYETLTEEPTDIFETKEEFPTVDEFEEPETLEELSGTDLVTEEQEETAIDETQSSQEVEDLHNDEGDAATTATTGSEDSIDAEELNVIQFPEQSFEVWTDTMVVTVVAPEGAFPAETRMEARDVNDDSTMECVADVLDEQVTVTAVHAVDITFYNTEDEEIEPLLPISIQMSLFEKPANDRDLTVVHIDDDGIASVVQQNTDPDNTGVTFIAEASEFQRR